MPPRELEGPCVFIDYMKFIREATSVFLSARRVEALPTRWVAGPFSLPCDVSTNGLADATIPQVRCILSRGTRGGGLVLFLHSFALLLLACLTEIPYTPGNSVALAKVQRI